MVTGPTMLGLWVRRPKEGVQYGREGGFRYNRSYAVGLYHGVGMGAGLGMPVTPTRDSL